MRLYKIKASDGYLFWGTAWIEGGKPITRDAIIIAQTPNCDAFLFLTKWNREGDEFNYLEELDSVPSGFDFTYCQAWGLTIDDDVVDRVIIDLRKKAYPSWEDQLDYIYHNGVDDWKTNIITPIKEKYPKR